MSSKEKIQKGNGCLGKIRYSSFEEANKSVAHHNQNKKTRKMRSYRCDDCGGYHYGHDQRKKMKQIKKDSFIPEYNPDEVYRGDGNKFLNIKTNN